MFDAPSGAKNGLQPYKWTWLSADLLPLFWGVGELWKTVKNVI